ncbi:energy transducer TonB [Thiomicrorhabdus indica]|uniref:energy transducer TonB n=1 Tax=Thiomicrorhabdus indica TaxID=2267253 RepID=UPI002AA63EE8|nr:energy transducer TonB [Thiomicrorhabdus indica]
MSSQKMVQKTKPLKPKYSAKQVMSAEQAYLSELRRQIMRYAQDSYPRRAKRRHWEGEVVVSFVLNRDGTISNVTLVNSSQREILDKAALSIFTEQMKKRFKAFPPEIQRQNWNISVPVNYHLR